MFRLLVVEDQVDFYKNYLMRIFSRILPMERISVDHAANLDEALFFLQEPWEAILMDYNLGPKTTFLGESVRNGADLVRFRRQLETDEKQSKALILGMASHRVGNGFLRWRGADAALLKIQVTSLASALKEAILAFEEAQPKASWLRNR